MPAKEFDGSAYRGSLGRPDTGNPQQVGDRQCAKFDKVLVTDIKKIGGQFKGIAVFGARSNE